MTHSDLIAFLSLGVLIIIQIIAISVFAGKISQRLNDLCDHVNKQNGRVAKLEQAEEECAKGVEHRMTKVETIQGNVLQRLDKIETIPNVH